MRLNALDDAQDIRPALARIHAQWRERPRVGIILGSGLGGIAELIEPAVVLDYDQIPGFPRSTAPGHRGRLVCGQLHGVSVAAMDGRIHLYEGYSAAQVTLPVRIFKSLGAEMLVLSNASGGLNPRYASGDIVAVADHINFMAGRTARLGMLPWRAGATSPYDPPLIQRALAAGRRAAFPCHAGVYVGVLGPNYETRAEYRFLRRIGGDVVGMSTVPEVLVAAHCGLKLLALSVVTNVARPDSPRQVHAQEVVDIAASAEPRLRAVLREVLK
jgi:purine-nucleoside phosphorylase